VNDVVIIGAGIAGLAAAWELRQRGIQPLVLEQSARAGGVIVTERMDGFVIDGGPDSLLVQKPAAVELCRELGLSERLFPTNPPRTAFVLRHGRLTPLPEASFLGLPTRLGPFIKSPLFSLAGKLRMATELVRPRGREPDESIGQFIGRRFGREAVEYLAEPLLAGIHVGEVDQLSVHALFPRLVSLEQTHGSVLRGLSATGTENPRSADGAFVSLPSGIAELPEALVTSLGSEAFRYRTRVMQISGISPYKLTLDTDAAIYARAVIVTTPAWAASQMLSSVDTALSRLCAEIPYASSATVAFGLPRHQIAHPLTGTGFVVPRKERKALMAGTWVSSKWPQRAPEGFALLRAFLGGATNPEVLDGSDEALASTAFTDLAALLEITGEPSIVRVFRWPRATPQYVVGHGERVRNIEERLTRYPGLFVTGSGYRGTGIPDCIADARRTATAAAAIVRSAPTP
jgi:protoporphyrinogen/coproporphyrinogen III oxidase